MVINRSYLLYIARDGPNEYLIESVVAIVHTSGGIWTARSQNSAARRPAPRPPRPAARRRELVITTDNYILSETQAKTFLLNVYLSAGRDSEQNPKASGISAGACARPHLLTRDCLLVCAPAPRPRPARAHDVTTCVRQRMKYEQTNKSWQPDRNRRRPSFAVSKILSETRPGE
ncbi:hypothetical protein EVAR_61082_1 [Eumeta japonica]|uniref:Uncharacterized protein n=1 Tax=Eumeta variegata TaxID=151549 RepID=A0A4C1YPM4_EUMVA|nr:hypothetical protein EVAR_61082_1 [Eumeta japonica]